MRQEFQKARSLKLQREQLKRTRPIGFRIRGEGLVLGLGIHVWGLGYIGFRV